ncbi:MAG: MBL fold metallo-hydrolase [Spirochaetales bacterium]|nr:MAG: MBL fold metallo-hydrolase [Spirochaetales bacterium]
MIITPLMEDYCPKGGFRGEHGLSLFIETQKARIIFDTGQTSALLQNARTLEIDLARVDAVVLSHGHYDHCGGLDALYAAIAPVSPLLYAGKGYSNPKLAKTESGSRDIGVPAPAGPGRAPRAIEVAGFREIAPRVFLLPHAKIVDGLSANPRFRTVVDGEERLDEFDDEVSLAFDEADGIVVVTGCAHRGIVNILEEARLAFPGRPVSAVVGGFHLVDAPRETIDRVVDGIAAIAPGKILCGHCTGPRGFAALYARFPDRVAWLSCGLRSEF